MSVLTRRKCTPHLGVRTGPFQDLRFKQQIRLLEIKRISTEHQSESGSVGGCSFTKFSQDMKHNWTLKAAYESENQCSEL